MSSYSSTAPLLIGIDGRSGSGKTLLSSVLAENLADAHEVTVLRLEDLYQGWDGLQTGMQIFTDEVLPKLAAGETATYQTWDWHAAQSHEGGPGDVVTTEPTEVIICEGVGVGARANRELLDLLIWLRVPDQVRYDRAMQRDGASYTKQWENWATQERNMLDQDQIYDEADLVLVADEPDQRHHTSALAMVTAMLNSPRSLEGPADNSAVEE